MTLELSGVAATYRRRPVFANVDLHAGPGEIVGLIGPNGAGKTTLLRIAAGLIRPSLGRVERSGPVMYFGGESTLPGRCRADRWAGLFRAQPPARRRIARLSRGTRQLLGLAAFFSDEEWAIGLLDEPWEGLDPAGARWLTGALRRHQSRGATLIVSSHRLHDAAEICSAYGFLANGAFRPMALEDIARGAEHVGARELARAFDDFTRG